MKNKFLFITLFAVSCYAQNLYPDIGFGSNGVSNPDVYGMRYMFPAPDGKIFCIRGSLQGISCVDQDGISDTDFGENGIVSFIPQFGDGIVEGYDVNWLVSNATHLFAVGYFHPQGTDDGNIFVAKMDFEGNLDLTYGLDGIVTVDLGEDERPFRAILTVTGKILCVGWRETSSQRKILLVMLNSDGSRDTSFGTEGAKEISLYPGGTFPGDVVEGFDHKFYISCEGGNGFGPMESCIVKIDQSGNFDPGFDGDGVLYFNTPDAEMISRLAVQGKNLYAFSSHYASTPVAGYVNKIRVYDLEEHEVTLTLPLTVTTRTSDFYVKPNGRIVTYGHNFCSSSCYGSDVTLSQYLPGGSLDTSFNTTGTYQFNFNNFDGNNTYEFPGMICPMGNKILISAMYWNEPIPNMPAVPYLTIARLTTEALGTDEVTSRQLVLYPNPASKELKVTARESARITSVTVVNMIGETMSIKEFSTDNGINVDVSALPTGVYLLTATDVQENSCQAKFIKN